VVVTRPACATPRFWGGLRLVAAGRRFAAGRAFALVRRFLVVRGFEVARRFAVFRCFEVVRRFTGFRFFRDKREVAARFLRFAIVGSCWGKYSSKENLPAKRRLRAARLTCHYDRCAGRAAYNSTFVQRPMSWNSLIPKASNHEGFAVT